MSYLIFCLIFNWSIGFNIGPYHYSGRRTSFQIHNFYYKKNIDQILSLKKSCLTLHNMLLSRAPVHACYTTTVYNTTTQKICSLVPVHAYYTTAAHNTTTQKICSLVLPCPPAAQQQLCPPRTCLLFARHTRICYLPATYALVACVPDTRAFV